MLAEWKQVSPFPKRRPGRGAGRPELVGMAVAGLRVLPCSNGRLPLWGDPPGLAPGAEVQCPRGHLSRPSCRVCCRVSPISSSQNGGGCRARRLGPGTRTWGLITGLWLGWEVLFPGSPGLLCSPDILSDSGLARASGGSGAQGGLLISPSPSESVSAVRRALLPKPPDW